MGNDMFNAEQLADAKVRTDEATIAALRADLAAAREERDENHKKLRAAWEVFPSVERVAPDSLADAIRGLRSERDAAREARDMDYRQRIANHNRAEMAENALAGITSERDAARAERDEFRRERAAAVAREAGRPRPRPKGWSVAKALARCANGCDRPPKPPSLVICGECMDKITRTLEGLAARVKRAAKAQEENRAER